MNRNEQELQTCITDLEIFAHILAHDLRENLGIAQSLTEDIQKILDPFLFKQISHPMLHIKQCIRRMQDLIDGILRLSEIREAKVSFVPLNMKCIVAAAQSRLKDVIEESHAVIIFPSHWPLALGHPPWIEEVWYNYLSNAIAYSGHSSRIELGAKPGSNSNIYFWVQDDGPGIPDYHQEKLFMEFDNLRDSRLNSSGLGLSIVKRIVEKLGGEVGVESNPGQGSCFSFNLTCGKSVFSGKRMKDEWDLPTCRLERSPL